MVRMGRLMAWLANSGRPGGREKVALLTAVLPSSVADGGMNGPAGVNGRRARVCVSLQGPEALDPVQDGLVLWC